MLLIELKNIDDDMGTKLPVWIKAQQAKKTSASNESRATKATRMLVSQVKKLLTLMYPRSRQYTNYRTRTVTVKIDRPHIKDLSNPTLPDHDAYLAHTYGVQKRTVGGDTSVVYHIPYQD